MEGRWVQISRTALVGGILKNDLAVRHNIHGPRMGQSLLIMTFPESPSKGQILFSALSLKTGRSHHALENFPSGHQEIFVCLFYCCKNTQPEIYPLNKFLNVQENIVKTIGTMKFSIIRLSEG